MAANPYKGMTIDLNGDVTDFSKALRDAKDIAKGTTTELRELTKALKVDPTNAKLLEQAQEQYRKQIQASEKELEILRKKEEEILNDPKGKDSVSSEVWTKLQADIAKCETKLKDTKKALKDLDFEPAIKAAREETKSTVQELERLEQSLKLDPKSLDLLAQKQEVLTRAIEASKKEAEALHKKEQELGKEKMSTAEWTNLQADIHDAEKAAESYERELKEVAQLQEAAVPKLFIHTGEDIKKAAEEVKEGAESMEDSIEEVIDDIEEEFEELGDEAEDSGRKVGETLQKVGEKIQGVGGTISHIGDSYTRNISVPIVGAAAASVKAAVDIDSALTDVRKTVDATEEEYQELKQAAIDYSKTNAVNAADILSLQALGAQLGFAKDELAKFGEVASGLDIATNMDAETAATEMAHFANIVTMSHDEIDKYASTIVELGNNTATTESDISAMAQRIASAGKSIGLTTPEVLGLAATFSSLGIEAEAGGTAISTILSNIDEAASMGTEGIKQYADELEMSTGDFLKYLNQDKQAMEEYAQQTGIKTSEAKKYWKTFFTSFAAEHGMKFDTFKTHLNSSILDLQAWSEAAGMSADDFAKAWKEKPLEAFQLVIKGLQNGVEEGSSLSVLLTNLGIDTIRQSQLMKNLANSGDLMNNTIDIANRGWEENIALGKEVENRNNSLASKFEILKNRVTAVANDVGGPLVDALMEAIDAAEPLFKSIEEGAKAFSSMSKEEQLSIMQTVGMVAAIGPLLSVFGRLTTGVGGVVKAFGSVGSALGSFGKTGKAAAAAVEGTSKAMGAATTVASGLKGGLIGLGVAAATVAAGLAIKAWMDYQHELELTTKGAKSLADMETEAEGKLNAYGSSLQETTKKTNELREAQARSNDEFVNSLTSFGTDNQMVQTYLDTMIELSARAGLTREEQEKLTLAVKGYNELTGANIEIIDKENGKLSESTAALLENRDAWIKNQTVKIYEDKYTEALRESIEAEDELKNATQERIDAQKRVNDLTAEMAKHPELAESYQVMLDLANKELEEAKKDEENLIAVRDHAKQQMVDIEKRIQEVNNAYDDQKSTLDNTRAAIQLYGEETISTLQATGYSVDDLAGRLVNSGLNAMSLRDISKQAFDDMWRSCNNDVNLMIDKISKYNELPIKAKTAVVNGDVEDVYNKVQELQRMKLKPITQKFVAELDTGNGRKFGNTNIPWGRNAAGGLFRNAGILNSIPKHADGFIGDKPMLTSVGWAFEAGSEALIPLDNKQKVAPFAKAVASFMPSGGDTYLVIDGAVVNSNPQIKQTFLDLFEDVFRMGGMNRG